MPAAAVAPAPLPAAPVVHPIDSGIKNLDVYRLEKAMFLNRNPSYGYGGKIDTLYPAEVGGGGG